MERDPNCKATPDASGINVSIQRFVGLERQPKADVLAVEEPLEIRLGYGPRSSRRVKPVTITMRTPGRDFELSAGFLLTEGVIRDENDIDRIEYVVRTSVLEEVSDEPADTGKRLVATQQTNLKTSIVCVQLGPKVEVDTASLERNFYATSSCGVCGKASLSALRAVCPPRMPNRLEVDAHVLYSLTSALRKRQRTFNLTGGLHAAGLFDRRGVLQSISQDIGRHNAVDKLVGSEFLADNTPLRESILLLSGRASFELIQKALMAGIPMIASVGAPSSLAVEMAREFDITLVGFLGDSQFNVYHGAARVLPGVHVGGRRSM